MIRTKTHFQYIMCSSVLIIHYLWALNLLYQLIRQTHILFEHKLKFENVFYVILLYVIETLFYARCITACFTNNLLTSEIQYSF